jgi:hypothetical protein
MFHRSFISRISLFIPVLLGAAVPAYAQRPATWVVPNVVEQFNALTERADPLGFDIVDSPNPSTCRHYQGLARLEGPDGTPYLIVTRSGNTPELPGPDDPLCDDSPGETGHGNFIVVRMGSRDKEGERFRSNRQTKGHGINVTPPDPRDRVATWFKFQNGLGFPFYGHPGGMQTSGHMLALAVEHPYLSSLPKTIVLIINMKDPINPEIRSTFPVEPEVGEKAGLVALTQLADGHYLMMVTGGSNEKLQFYRSTLTDLMNDTLSWVPLDAWQADPLFQTDPQEPEFVCYPGSVRWGSRCVSPDEVQSGANWPTTGAGNGNPHQTLQFIREGSINGALFLAGNRGRIWGDDFMDLYRVECDTPFCLPGEQVRLAHVSTRHMISNPSFGGDRLANFAAASTFYVSPSQELLLYATEHDNDGPSGSVKMGEWRHRNMARDGSPTLLPTLTVNGPFTVDEGSVGTLSAAAKQPATKAWMQLFTEPQYGGQYVVVDYDDYVLDDYNQLWFFEGPFGYYQLTQSWKYFAPLFCNALAVGDDVYDQSDVPYLRTLAGFGGPLGNPDLKLIKDDSGTVDMDKRTSGVDFLEGCDSYYHSPFNVLWDRDGDGGYETVGTSTEFDARTLDGRDSFSISIPVRAVHPDGGNQLNDTAVVKVRNVAPTIAGFQLKNSAGQRIGVDVSFALVNTRLTVSASFTDPGRPDHQTAQVNWGDNVVESQTAFTTFTDAFDGAIGTLAHTHRYLVSGQVELKLAVTDDDGGAGESSMPVRLLTPAEALQEALTLLDAVIAAAKKPAVRATLIKARIAIVGHGTASDGALRMLAENQPDAAAAFVLVAVNWVQDARTLGATNVDALITMLQQVYLSLTGA